MLPWAISQDGGVVLSIIEIQINTVEWREAPTATQQFWLVQLEINLDTNQDLNTFSTKYEHSF